MQHILDHPENHDQRHWMCGTSACFAGHALLLNGMPWSELNSMLRAQLSPRFVAMDALGLDYHEGGILFAGTNSRAMLELMVKDLANGDVLQDRERYAELTGEHAVLFLWRI